MAGRIDQMRTRYKEFADGDVQSATQEWADDMEWEASDAGGLPGGGMHSGKDQVMEVLGEAVGAWDEFSLTADEFFEDEDTVVVLAHTDLKKDGEAATVPVVHVWRWEGDQVKRLQIVSDTFQSAQLLGKT